jgi:hypothetical protein
LVILRNRHLAVLCAVTGVALAVVIGACGFLAATEPWRDPTDLQRELETRGALPELPWRLDERALWFGAKDVHALASGLTGILTDPSCAPNLRTAARDAALSAPEPAVFLSIARNLAEWLSEERSGAANEVEFRQGIRDRLVSVTWQMGGLRLEEAAHLLNELDPGWPSLVARYANYAPPEYPTPVPWVTEEQRDRATRLLELVGKTDLAGPGVTGSDAAADDRDRP